MRKPLSPELEQVLADLAKAVGGDGPFYVLTPRICDKCGDESKEAFPYGIVDDGKEYQHLCNECFVILCPDFARCEVCELYEKDCICDTLKEMAKVMGKIFDELLKDDALRLNVAIDEILAAERKRHASDG